MSGSWEIEKLLVSMWGNEHNTGLKINRNFWGKFLRRALLKLNFCMQIVHTTYKFGCFLIFKAQAQHSSRVYNFIHERVQRARRHCTIEQLSDLQSIDSLRKYFSSSLLFSMNEHTIWCLCRIYTKAVWLEGTLKWAYFVFHHFPVRCGSHFWSIKFRPFVHCV